MVLVLVAREVDHIARHNAVLQVQLGRRPAQLHSRGVQGQRRQGQRNTRGGSLLGLDNDRVGFVAQAKLSRLKTEYTHQMQVPGW